MKKSLLLFLVCLLGCVTYVNAQYVQERPSCEYMLKIEAGYMPYVTNVLDKSENGFLLPNQEHAANINILNGMNISQDFFLGLGLGYAYMAPIKDIANGCHNGLAFVDMDYRPLNDEWAPMLGARVGGSIMLESGIYSTTLTPYVEVYGGINYYYRHVYRNMERNNHAWFAELGVAYMFKTIFVPIRIGFRL